MKTNFKKIMSVVLVMMMIFSIFSINASAAYTYTITLKPGSAKTLNGIKYTPEFIDELQGLTKYTDPDTGYEYTLNQSTKAVTFKVTGATRPVSFTLPKALYKMDQHEQLKWGSISVGGKASVRANTTYTASYTAIGYEIMFAPAEGEEAQAVPLNNNTANNTFNKSIKLLDAQFKKPGYIQCGWYLKVPGAVAGEFTEQDFDLLQDKVLITGNMMFYPRWREINYDIKYDVTTLKFPAVCEDYKSDDIAEQTVTITNNSDADVTFNVENNNIFTVTGDTTIPMNASVTLTIKPIAGMVPGKYTEDILFNFGNAKANFTVTASMFVREHMFIKYVYNNDATYISDGTQTAECFSGCGATHTQAAAGTMKVYSADNNKADGLLKEYLYHKTVNFVAYGSGMDYTANELGLAVANNVEVKRFRPVSWYVNETFNGEFTADTLDYTVKYVHKDYGKFALEIKYVEEQYTDGEWVATGVEDVKNFNYSIGPSEDDVQNVEMPKMITSIIFALMAYLVDAIGGLLG